MRPRPGPGATSWSRTGSRAPSQRYLPPASLPSSRSPSSSGSPSLLLLSFPPPAPLPSSRPPSLLPLPRLLAANQPPGALVHPRQGPVTSYIMEQNWLARSTAKARTSSLTPA